MVKIITQSVVIHVFTFVNTNIFPSTVETKNLKRNTMRIHRIFIEVLIHTKHKARKMKPRRFDIVSIYYI